jgi:hypothetical protein
LRKYRFGITEKRAPLLWQKRLEIKIDLDEKEKGEKERKVDRQTDRL